MTTDNTNDGGLPQSDEILSSEPQAFTAAPVQVNVPVERDLPAPAPALDSIAPAQPEEALAIPAEAVPPLTASDDIPSSTDAVLDVLPVEAAPVAEVAQAPVAAEAEDGELQQGEGSSFSFPASDFKGNVVQEKPTYAPLDKAVLTTPIIAMPADTTKRVSQYVLAQPRTDLTDTDKGEQWANILTAGSEHGWHNDFGINVTDRPEGKWVQRVRHGEGRPMEAAMPQLGDDGPTLSGERGVLRMNFLLGRGGIVSIPLWHSGFWITFKQPSETQLVDLDERISADKALLGRMTHGLVFANNSAYIARALVDLAFDCIYETTIKDMDDLSKLRKLISAPDLHTIAWGLAVVIYPRGFQYLRSLLDEKGQRTETIHEKLNVASLQWVDDNSLTDWQRAHMNSRQSYSMSVQTIEMYQDRFTRGKPKTYKLSDDLSVTLKVPSLDEYLNAGFTWVDEMARSINQAFTQETTLARRNELMMRAGKATSMRQYVHWIKSFELPNKEKNMSEEKSIELACNSLSSDDDLRNNFYRVVQEFMGESLVSIIATPLLAEAERQLANPKFPWLLPIDPLSVFTTLLSLKVSQIEMRP